ncbi:hypothetical protein D3C71_1574220 [compost metagenome]
MWVFSSGLNKPPTVQPTALLSPSTVSLPSALPGAKPGTRDCASAVPKSMLLLSSMVRCSTNTEAPKDTYGLTS